MPGIGQSYLKPGPIDRILSRALAGSRLDWPDPRPFLRSRSAGAKELTALIFARPLFLIWP
jgi:hypothetical protein